MEFEGFESFPSAIGCRPYPAPTLIGYTAPEGDETMIGNIPSVKVCHD